MDRLFIQMIKEIIDIISTKKININDVSNQIGITTTTLIEYLNLKQKDFSMYLLILDTLKNEVKYE